MPSIVVYFFICLYRLRSLTCVSFIPLLFFILYCWRSLRLSLRISLRAAASVIVVHMANKKSWIILNLESQNPEGRSLKKEPRPFILNMMTSQSQNRKRFEETPYFPLPLGCQNEPLSTRVRWPVCWRSGQVGARCHGSTALISLDPLASLGPA